jgi:TQXA domain-containing protein
MTERRTDLPQVPWRTLRLQRPRRDTRTMSQQSWRVPVLLVLALGALLLQAAPAGAVVYPTHREAPPALRTGTEMTMSGTGFGRPVTGFIANAVNPFDPVRDGYPDANPGSGFSPKDEGFAGIIHGAPTDGSPELELYCIDIDTFTYGGIGYALGTWDDSTVPNVGYVARILSEAFPNTDEPADLTDLNQKAAAVQAAIWFFSDRYVLNTSDPLHDAVATIVERIRTEGPLVQPPPPSLTLTPSLRSGPVGSAVGPFKVATSAATTVTATGGALFSDKEGTKPIANPVQNGDEIWVRSTGSSSAVLQATSTATVPTGNVYLYAGNNPGVTKAQKLILAHDATLTTTVRAIATFLPHGSLIVTKTIAGPAAGSQGRVVIHVACDGADYPDFVIDPGASAGDRTKTYENLPAGSTCTVIETSNGSNGATTVVITGDNGKPVTIPSGKSATAHITDTYGFVPGSLLVRKTVAGPGAGQQGEIRIHTECDGKALTPDFVIPAGTPAGDRTKQYDKIPAPATCTVTETADGHTSAVSVVVKGSGQKVSVPAGRIVEADVSDTYGLLPGQLEVTKSIAGPLAGQQGTVVIHTVCNGVALTPDFVIPAGAPAGVQSQIYSNLPTPARCVVTETADGSTGAVSVGVSGSPQTTTIPPGGAGAAHITDTYGARDGSLLVTKTIAGPRAGHQGPVIIRVACNGTARSPNFVIAAKTRRGRVSRSFDGIPAGSACRVTETADGATAKVTVTVVGNGRRATVPAGRVVAVSLMDVYTATPGFLRVTKTIAGPAARLHGRIAILAACGGRNVFAFRIPARTRARVVSRTFAGLRARARCRVIEVVAGRTHRVALVAARRHRRVTIRANGSVTAHLIDRFARARAAPRFTG